ncbi:uncharacterized protein [Diadema antillarum]|uniref:uncharacterized protein n=1 Tax=Diadema antillarum TaxID=105358 RepID=UPI003A84E902
MTTSSTTSWGSQENLTPVETTTLGSESTSPATGKDMSSSAAQQTTISMMTTISTSKMETTADVETTESTTVQQCSLTACENGGTYDQTSCSCDCTTGYQGDTCAVPKAEIQHSVVLSISGSLLQWQRIQPLLIGIIAQMTTDYCNNHYTVCCPLSGTKTNPLTLDYVTTSDVSIVSGYPQPSEQGGSFVVAAYVKPPPDNQLCAEGGSTSGQRRRRRRGIDDLSVNPTTANGESEFLPQSVLYEIIKDNLHLIEDAINATVGEVTLGEVEPERES